MRLGINRSIALAPRVARASQATLALAFVRSATQPAPGSASGESASVPSGADALWFAQNGGAWTQIVGDFADMPFTLTAASPSDVAVVGAVATRTSGTGGVGPGTANIGPTYNSGARFRFKQRDSTKAYYAGIITPTQSDFYAYWAQGGANGYANATGALQNTNDILETRRAADGITMSSTQNGTLVGGAGATAYGGATASTPGIGTFWLTDQGAELEVMGWGPIGADAAIKVAQTSPDGSTWRVPTVGDTHLRVSNDAGITTPGVVVA